MSRLPVTPAEYKKRQGFAVWPEALSVGWAIYLVAKQDMNYRIFTLSLLWVSGKNLGIDKYE